MALAEECDSEGFPLTPDVCKELVYAFTMWFSPALHLKVIRAYDTLQTQAMAVVDRAAADLLAAKKHGLTLFRHVRSKINDVRLTLPSGGRAPTRCPVLCRFFALQDSSALSPATGYGQWLEPDVAGWEVMAPSRGRRPTDTQLLRPVLKEG